MEHLKQSTRVEGQKQEKGCIPAYFAFSTLFHEEDERIAEQETVKHDNDTLILSIRSLLNGQL